MPDEVAVLADGAVLGECYYNGYFRLHICINRLRTDAVRPYTDTSAFIASYGL